MKLIDKVALDLLEKANSTELDCAIYDMTEEDREGRTDLQVLADEVDWILYGFTEDDGCCRFYDLKEARSKLRRTENGKVIPISSETFRPLPGYRPDEINDARDLVNEINRLKRLQKKIASLIW